jgi:hydroxyethylthiazole kinase
MHAPSLPQFTSELPGIAGDILTRIRARHPRVHCITNAVAQNFTANMLLAAGAIPSMTVAPDEVGVFVARADALLVNLGTFDRERREATEIAIAEAARAGRPWVLDPVFVDRSPARAAFARSLAMKRPAAVRLNAAEFSALAGTPPEGEALQRYARDHGSIVALTGATDEVTDGTRVVRVANGDPLMGRVTAMGCAGTAVVAAALAVEADALAAVAAALLLFAVAGEVAAMRARGPGSFAMEIVDALYGLDQDTLRERGRVT